MAKVIYTLTRMEELPDMSRIRTDAGIFGGKGYRIEETWSSDRLPGLSSGSEMSAIRVAAQNLAERLGLPEISIEATIEK